MLEPAGYYPPAEPTAGMDYYSTRPYCPSAHCTSGGFQSPRTAYGRTASPGARVPGAAGSSIVCPSLVVDTPEVARRAAEFDREIENLDQKELEIHQTQLRIIREQSAAFRNDLAALRQEIVDLRALVMKHEVLHADLSESLLRHQQLHRDAEGKFEWARQELEDTAARLGQLADARRSPDPSSVGLADRLTYVEHSLGDSLARQSKDLQAALDWSRADPSVMQRLLSLERGAGGDAASIQEANLAIADIKNSQRSMAQALQAQANDIDGIKDASEKIDSLLQSHRNMSKALNAQAEEIESLKDVNERVESLRKSYKELLRALDMQADETQALKERAGKGANDLDGRVSHLERVTLDGSHREVKPGASLQERVDAVEKNLGFPSGTTIRSSVNERLISVEGMANEAAKRRPDQDLGNELAKFRAEWQSKTESLVSQLAEEKKARESGDDKAQRGARSMFDDLAKHLEDEKLAREAGVEALNKLKASLEARISDIEGPLRQFSGDFQDVWRMLQDLQNALNQLTGSDQNTKAMLQIVEDRLNYIENWFHTFRGYSYKAP